MSKKFPSQELEKFIIRLPAGMRERIGAAARANNRSMNAEIVSRLEASLPGEQAAEVAEHVTIPEGSAAIDILIELQHQMGQLTKVIEQLPERLGRSKAGRKTSTLRLTRKKP